MSPLESDFLLNTHATPLPARTSVGATGSARAAAFSAVFVAAATALPSPALAGTSDYHQACQFRGKIKMELVKGPDSPQRPTLSMDVCTIRESTRTYRAELRWYVSRPLHRDGRVHTDYRLELYRVDTQQRVLPAPDQPSPEKKMTWVLPYTTWVSTKPFTGDGVHCYQARTAATLIFASEEGGVWRSAPQRLEAQYAC